MHVETLESRRLLSVSYNAGTQTLTIVGLDSGEGPFGDGGDYIYATVEDGLLKVSDNAVPYERRSATIKTIVVHTRGGHNDRVHFDASVAQDVIVDTGINDERDGFGDYVETGSGNDKVYALGTGSEAPYVHVDTGAGDDKIFVETIFAEVIAGPGDDLVQIGSNASYAHVFGDDGRDRIFMSAYYAQADGGDGDDEICSSENFALLNGGAGNDLVANGGRISTVFGGPGNDRLINAAPTSRHNAYDGGPGFDTIDYSAATVGLLIRNGQAGEYVHRTGRPPTLKADQDDTLAAFEAFYGGTRNDYIYGDDRGNYIRGNGGDDYIQGNGGDDLLEGNAGRNVIFGNAGNDTIRTRNGVGEYANGGAGRDRAEADAYDVLDSVERRA